MPALISQNPLKYAAGRDYNAFSYKRPSAPAAKPPSASQAYLTGGLAHSALLPRCEYTYFVHVPPRQAEFFRLCLLTCRNNRPAYTVYCGILLLQGILPHVYQSPPCCGSGAGSAQLLPAS